MGLHNHKADICIASIFPAVNTGANPQRYLHCPSLKGKHNKPGNDSRPNRRIQELGERIAGGMVKGRDQEEKRVQNGKGGFYNIKLCFINHLLCAILYCLLLIFPTALGSKCY